MPDPPTARQAAVRSAGDGGLCLDEGGLSFVTLIFVHTGSLHINENWEGDWQKALV
jgi:hypothetical protein